MHLWSKKMPKPPGQGEYPYCGKQPPHIDEIRNNPAQETQEMHVHLPPLENVCSSQTQKLCWTQGEQGQALARLEVTKTGDQ